MKNKLISKAENALAVYSVRAIQSTEQTITELLKTKWGKYAIAVPMAMCGMSVTAFADGDATGDANKILDTIMGALGPGVIALGTLVAVVGGIQIGKGFTRDDADAKASGMMTMIGGIIIGAVGGVVSQVKVNINSAGG